MLNRNARGFGIIHELTSLESRVRRELAVANNNVYIAAQMIEDGEPDLDKLKLLLEEARDTLATVLGD